MMENADVLLVYPPHRKITFVSSIPHLSAYAKKMGFSVDALDAPTLGLDVHDIVDYVGATNPRSVGISIPFTPLAESGLLLVKLLNKIHPEIPLIVGGVHVTLHPHEFTDYAFICKGDGEGVLNYFLRLLNQEDLGEPRILEIPFPIEEIEPPDWGIVASGKYQLVLPTGERGFPIQGSRGCVYNCIFCASTLLYAHGIQYKTMEQIDREISNGIKRFGFKAISFRDENITLNRERFLEYCDYLKEHSIIWWAQTRANLVDEEMMIIAKDSGCRGITLGVETGDPYVMKMIKKGVTLEQVEEAFRILKKVGLGTAANFMIGHPWDTLGTVERTLEFADKIDPDYLGVQIATPFPATEFRKIAFEQGANLKENWGNYDTARKDNYTPPGLKGFDLSKMRDQMEWRWFNLKPSRFWIILKDRRSLKAKLRYLKRMWCLKK
jgi:radical SAM superfamily enzyme YgiQ (UPF0313 family)